MGAVDRWVESDGVRLAVREEGNRAGPTILLVHGYPDSAALWDPVVRHLRHRFRIVRYDVRGAGRSGRPAEQDGYRLDRLAADLAAVAREVSPGRPVHLVGHDWGSVQGWEAVTSSAHAPLFASFTSISGPNLDLGARWLRAEWSGGNRIRVAGQALLSSYVWFTHVPVLSDLACQLLNSCRAWLLRRKGIATSPTPGRDAVNGLGLYRANILARLREPRPRRCTVPVLLVVLTRDLVVRPWVFDDLGEWCPAVRRREVRAGHWAPHSHPGVLARLITDFVEYGAANRPAS
ncbi:hypothetical protein GCM10012275_13360 [Longimycelium tulufanense]|uniref:AB hydrolase-1 domain-containing protein n=1 Tax=Longimycelium tulufanense TaxID=907463 RepID=A0A8J3CAD8_9PSEU|nr:alpha/beta fold hydrolase [Longimycelium tulufanense]GGM43698.1 hypothetical protein GCM10012275_13360 [Longimycelium tulufanense]